MGLFVDWTLMTTVRMNVHFEVIILGSLFAIPGEAQSLSIFNILKGQYRAIFIVNCEDLGTSLNPKLFVRLQVRDDVPRLESFGNIAQDDTNVVLVCLDGAIVVR